MFRVLTPCHVNSRCKPGSRNSDQYTKHTITNIKTMHNDNVHYLKLSAGFSYDSRTTFVAF